MLRRIQDPQTEPVSVEELAAYLRLDPEAQGEEQALLALLLTAAREFVEEYTCRSLITQKWQYYVQNAYGVHLRDLPRPPVQTVEERTADYIVYTAGYGDVPESVPAPIRNAIMQYAAFLYENRGDLNAEPPQAVLQLLRPYVVRKL